MEALRTFFELNGPIIQFLYGLVYFVLGLAIALHSRSYSRLELARSLSWLAAFGLAHGAYEWSELFAPVQEAYLSAAGIRALHIIHLVLLALSFGCLFEFGVALLRPLGRGQWLHAVTAGLLVGYTLLVVALPLRLADAHAWHATAEALARYAIAFPGGLLAAYGLREQTFRHIAPLEVPHIIRTLRVAGVALALYAVFGGLIPPAAPFFPASWLNADTFEAALGLPPLVVNALIGAALTIPVVRALEVFDLEVQRLIENMEQAELLAAERTRIARELHDGAIQTVYTAGLLVESAQKQSPPGGPVAARLERAMGVLNDAIAALRRNLVELAPAPASEPLAGALRRLAADPRYRSLVEVTFQSNLPEEGCLSPARTGHVLAVATEALANVVRHASARRAHLAAALHDGRLRLTITDDGSGLNGQPGAGFGLRNMRDRARLLGGRLEVSGAPGGGTRVLLEVPWEEERG